MKNLTYPPFKVTCIVKVQLPENKSYSPDIAVRLSFYIQHWGDIHSHAKCEAIFRLERLGVEKGLLDNADFETEDCSYVAVEPKGVKREYGVPVEAFYLHDPKKRELLIRQRRLVPESHAEMLEMYGTPAKATAEAVPA